MKPAAGNRQQGPGKTQTTKWNAKTGEVFDAVQAIEMRIFRTCPVFFEKEMPAASTRRLTKVQEKSI
jgi:hypothetical protein